MTLNPTPRESCRGWRALAGTRSARAQPQRTHVPFRRVPSSGGRCMRTEGNKRINYLVVTRVVSGALFGLLVASGAMTMNADAQRRGDQAIPALAESPMLGIHWARGAAPAHAKSSANM